MKVILKKRVPNLGHEWDVVTVKDGYARNFLLPQQLAVVATPALIKNAEKRAGERMKQMEELVASAKESAEKLADVTLNFRKKAKDGKLYGSIAEKDIVESLKKNHKMDFDKDVVQMSEHLKTIGDHKVKLHLAEGVEVEISVKVEAE
jgi:large subunit ribosomal protein L9